MSFITDLIRSFLVDRPARKKNLAEHIRTLEEGKEKMSQRQTTSPDTEKNKNQLAHIIGIERWGQNRLKVALGEPFKLDESDDYYPEKGLSWSELGKVFSETRDQTIDIARNLQDSKVPLDTTIRHNQFGNMEIRSWLQYLNFHANTEAKRIK